MEDPAAVSQGRVLYDWPDAACNPTLQFIGSSQLGAAAYDVAIIGAGVVGCALAYTLSRYQLRVVLVDREFDVGAGTSKANSAIIHTGFDATPGSLEAQLVAKASTLWPELAWKLKVPFEARGAVLLALDEEQAAQLGKIHTKALLNGVTDVRRLSAADVLKIEPNAPQTVRGGLLVPRESIIDPFGAPIAFAEVAIANGVDIILGLDITSIEQPGGAVKTLLSRSGRRVRARTVVNVAGLGGRALADSYQGAPFDINPRRGQFLIFDKCANTLVSSILLPVPTAQTKGMLVIPTIFGNLLAGPTAEDLPPGSAEATHTTDAGLDSVRAAALRLLPKLAGQPVIASYAGARCNCTQGSYLIHYNDPHAGILTVTGIRSTGLSASPALATYLAEGLSEYCGLALDEKDDATESRDGNLWPGWWRHPFEDPDRLAERPAYGRILCSCESISHGELEDALDAPLPPHTLDALKRRTRALAGRCQGCQCQMKVAEMLAAHHAIALDRVTKNGPVAQ
jgi:glycerol-3-phosphate dehydrogenase